MTKKKIIFLIFITMLFFTGSSKVFAATKCKSVDCKDEIEEFRKKRENKSRKMVCSYAVEKRDSAGEYYANLIYYDINEKKFYVETSIKGMYGELKTTSPRFILGDAVDVLKSLNRCPRYSYIDFKYSNEVCFDSDGTSCNSYTATNVEFSPKENSKLIDDKVSEYKNYDNTFTGSCDKDNKLVQQYGGFCRYIDSSSADYILVYYNDTSSTVVLYKGTSNEYYTIESGSSVENHFNAIEGLNSCPNEIYYIETTKRVIRNKHSVKTTSYSISTEKPSEESIVNGTTTTTESSTTYKLNQCTDDNEVITKPEKKGCELIPSKIMEYINEAMSIIRIAVPALLVGLIIFDFASALFASSEEKMKKAQGKVIKRIIIAIIIFFVPALINLVLNIVNDVWSNANYEICGLDK